MESRNSEIQNDCHFILTEYSFHLSNNDIHFNGDHINNKPLLLDLKTPRKVLLHKIIRSGTRNLPKYFQFTF